MTTRSEHGSLVPAIATGFCEGIRHPARFLFAPTPDGKRDTHAVALLDHLVAPASAPPANLPASVAEILT